MPSFETAACRECGMTLHLDADGEHPPWFYRRLCTLCVNPAEYPDHFQGGIVTENQTTCQCACGKAGHWVEAKPIEYNPKPAPVWLKGLVAAAIRWMDRPKVR